MEVGPLGLNTPNPTEISFSMSFSFFGLVGRRGFAIVLGFGDRRLRKYVSPGRKTKTAVLCQKTEKTEVQVSGAEIQTLVVDTRIAVWVSTAEKFVLRETRKSSRKFGVVSAPALHQTWPLPQAIGGNFYL